jgi:signal transduction histidine kinase
LSSWKVLKLPGDWSKAYNDKKFYRVAWHKKKLNFDKRLIGKKVTFYAISFFPEYQIYVDGRLVKSQDKITSQANFVTTDGIKASFTITKREHVLAIRMDSFIMRGIYASPFELRPYKDSDFFINAWDFLMRDFISIAGVFFLVTGIFFLFVFIQTKETFYKVPALLGIFAGIPHLFWSGLFVKFVGVKGSLFGIYLFLTATNLLVFLFIRGFIKINKWWLIFPVLALIQPVTIPVFMIHFNLAGFLLARKFAFIIVVPSTIFLCGKVLRSKKELGEYYWIVATGQIILTVLVVSAILVATGIYGKFQVLHLGFIGSISSILFLSAKNFAKTYRENQKNLIEVTHLKDNLEIIVKQRTAELEEEKNAISNLLHNMGQAVFSINFEGVIQPRAISSHALKLFGQSIKGKSVFDIVYPNIDKKSEEFSSLHFGIVTLYGGDDCQWQINQEMIPKRSTIKVDDKEKIIDILPNIIFEKDSKNLKELMLTCEDVTKKLELEATLERKTKEENKRNRIMQELAPKEGKDIAVHSKELKIFLNNTNERIEEIETFLNRVKGGDTASRSDFDMIWRNIHTVKGNSRGFGLSQFSTFIHGVESDLESLKGEFNHFDKKGAETVGNKLSSIKEIFDDYLNVAKNIFSIQVGEVSGEDNVYLEVHRDSIKKMNDFIEEVLKEPSSENLKKLALCREHLLKVPLKFFLESFKKFMDELSKEVGKSVNYIVEGDDIFVNDRELNLLNDSLIHLLRNSIDHGIETMAKREELGKHPSGNIVVRCLKNEEGYILTVKDDGAGISLEKVATIALKKELIVLEEYVLLSENEKLRLIFKTGFTTKKVVSEVSGRGIGMDVVLNNITKLGGVIDLKTEINYGTEFIIKVN